MLIADEHGAVIDANRAALDVLGYSILTVSRLCLCDLLSLGEAAGDAAWASVVGQGVWNGVLSARTRDGWSLHDRGAGERLYVFYLTIPAP